MNNRTLKTWRILWRSNFQAAIVSLSFFACTSRETAFRPLRLMIFLCIPATVLRTGTSSVNHQNCVSLVDPRRQLIYRLVHRLTEIIEFLSIHPPVEGSADIGAAQPEFDVILFVDHRILDTCKSGVHHRRIGRKRTLTIVRRTLTEPKAAFAGVIPAISFARFRDSMATFNEERAPSRPFGRWEFVSIVGNRGSCEKVARREGCEEGPGCYENGRSLCHDTPRANGAI